MRYLCVICLVLAIAGRSAAAHTNRDLNLSWQKTESSLTLVNRGKVVWQFNHGKDHPKPCFHPLATLDGTVLTEFRPSDHTWHRAAWFSLKEIDKLNYWEENRQGVSAGRNETIDVKIKTNADFSAEVRQRLSYHPPGEPELLCEERLIQISAPDEDGSYTLDWQHRFTARKAVTLGASGGYAGLSLRVSKQFLSWSFLNSEGESEVSKVHGKSARWLTYKGKTQHARAALTIFDHPANPRFPTKWFIVKDMPYFSPAFVFDGPTSLGKDQKIALFYRMKIHGTEPEAKQIEDDYRVFAKKRPELATLRTTGKLIDLVASGAKLHQTYCNLCHSIGREGESGKAGPGWYGLIDASKRQRKVMVKSKGIQSITIDEKYIAESIRQPNLHLAVRETSNQKDRIFPPSMPPYPHLSEQEIRSLIAFMKTLNEPKDRGPSEVWEVELAKPELPVDRFEVVVRDRPLVYRVAMADVSTRALSVGLPGGFNYIFDPSSFSVKRAWAGGFLNLKTERTGRGAGYNEYGANSRDIGFADCLFPLGTSGQIDQDFKDYINNQAWRNAASKSDMRSTTVFIDRKPMDGAQFCGYRFDGAQTPAFLFRINGVDYEQRIAFESDTVMHYYFATSGASVPLRFKIVKDKVREVHTSAGTWQGNILTIQPEDAAEFYITLILDPDKAQALFVKKWTLKELAAEADMASQRATPQNVKRGMIAFLKAGCIKCHPHNGQGAKTGPDLSKVASKYKGRRLLQQIIEPSSEINEDFQTWQLITKNGRVVTGLIVNDDGNNLTILTNPELPEKVERVAKNDVKERVLSKVSSMPLESISMLRRDEILDLLAHLEASGTVDTHGAPE